MGRAFCGGNVESLTAQLVLFTGKTHIHGQWRTKKQLWREVEKRGGMHTENQSASVTLLVLGDLSTQHVVDPVNDLSMKAKFVYRHSAAGNHICVVDEDGFSNLLDGKRAQCVKAKSIDEKTIEFIWPPEPELVPQVLGSPLKRRATPFHEPTGLEVDLSHMDFGTEAHEDVAIALQEHLRQRNVEVCHFGPGMPEFDAGWRDPADESLFYVAEVKSLTGANETQQIRLGIGQVLDYAHSVQTAMKSSNLRIVPIVVLQSEPSDPRWVALAESLEMILTWAPGFPRV